MKLRYSPTSPYVRKVMVVALETGLIVQVPPFIGEGERIRVSTSEGTYLERA